jgi:hypothetical protein
MTLTVRNFAIECRTPAEADSTRSRDVLDRTLAGIRRDLPRFLRHALSSEDDKKDIIFVERLAFEATISADWNEDVIAAEVGRQLLRQLRARLSDPGTQRFADAAELLARFLLDVAEGAAFTRDWHRMFEGLKVLPLSAMVRTLIERDGDAAVMALARLDRGSAEKIVAQMIDGDARRALTALSAGSARPCRDLRQIAEAMVTLAPAIFATGSPSAVTAHRHIVLAAALFRQTGLSADAITLRLADALVAAAQSGAPLENVPGSLATDFADREMIAASASEDDFKEALTILGRAIVRQAREPFARHTGAAMPHAPEQFARHGGVWLLLPYLLDHAPAATLTALALAAGTEARAVWRDGLLRDALGVAPDDDTFVDALMARDGPRVVASPHRPFAVRRRDQQHLLAAATTLAIPPPLLRLPRRLATYALRRYASRLPGFSESSFAHLWKNLLSTPATIRAGANQFLVGLTPPPLDVIWRISGAGAANYELADGRRVIVDVCR